MSEKKLYFYQKFITSFCLSLTPGSKSPLYYTNLSITIQAFYTLFCSFFLIMVQKAHYSKSASSQNFITAKSIFDHFEVILLNLKNISTARWFFFVNTIEKELFNGNIGLLNGLKKIYSFLCKRPFFDIFKCIGSGSNSIFVSVHAKWRKFSWTDSWRKLLRTLLEKLSFLFLLHAGKE